MGQWRIVVAIVCAYIHTYAQPTDNARGGRRAAPRGNGERTHGLNADCLSALSDYGIAASAQKRLKVPPKSFGNVHANKA